MSDSKTTLITSGDGGTLVEPGTWHKLFCLFGHSWKFHHERNPPVVTCARCGRTDPMPYGDARMDYL